MIFATTKVSVKPNVTSAHRVTIMKIVPVLYATTQNMKILHFCVFSPLANLVELIRTVLLIDATIVTVD